MYIPASLVWCHKTSDAIAVAEMPEINKRSLHEIDREVADAESCGGTQFISYLLSSFAVRRIGSSSNAECG
jgi:hypothetical protein